MTEHVSSPETEYNQDPAERFRRGMLLLQRIGGADFDGPINRRAPEVEDAAPEIRQRRRSRGLAALAATSSASGEAVVHSFDDVAPEIGGMILEFCYGDIFHRSGIDAKTRELTACAALAARGAATDATPLRVHIRAAIKAGARKDEVVETLLNMLPYSGYPAIRQAMILAGEEFAAILP